VPRQLGFDEEGDPVEIEIAGEPHIIWRRVGTHDVFS
jgi:hypothetical protein